MSIEEIKTLLLAYKTKGVLLDTNLLLVFVVGLFDPNRIPRFKRTATFSTDDFYLLAYLIRFFDRVITTPNILTEVNSLSNQFPENLKLAYYAEFARQIRMLEEHYLASDELSSGTSFYRLGLTDLGIAKLAERQHLVLSDDLKLVVHLQANGIDTINFNHVRHLGWKH